MEDLIDWHKLYKALQQKREERTKAVQVLQRGVRRSPATNVASNLIKIICIHIRWKDPR